MNNKTVKRINEILKVTSNNFGFLQKESELIEEVINVIIEKMKSGGKVMFCGNGGSAADAQHLSAELQGRYLLDRQPLAAIALTTNSSAITAIANDYDYEQIFERQVTGIGRTGDILICISTSGNSDNVINALKAAKSLGILTVGLTGDSGGKMEKFCDYCIKTPSKSTPRIQEMHITIGHIICEIIEEKMAIIS